MLEQTQEQPQVWIVPLADYSAGYGTGEWIDVINPEQLERDINEVLKNALTGPAEEFGVFDSRGFHQFPVSEFASVEEIVEIVEMLEEHGEVVGRLVDRFGDMEEAADKLDNKLVGVYESKNAFFREWAERDGGPLSRIPEDLHIYFDWDAFERDEEINTFDLFECSNGVYVFYSR